jgi:hypothetical protein
MSKSSGGTRIVSSVNAADSRKTSQIQGGES